MTLDGAEFSFSHPAVYSSHFRSVLFIVHSTLEFVSCPSFTMFAFSIPMVGALLAVVCHASPAPIKELAPRLAPATFHVEKSWNNDVLYQG